MTEVLWQEKTPYQELAVYRTAQYGLMLVLDQAVQTTDADEFFYHEMLVHVPLVAHPDPRRVLIIGGGDGGTLREALKHPSVERVDMVEIDLRVVEAGRRFFPALSASFADPRANLLIADGIRHVAEAPPGEYDCILVDSTDPVGPAVGLFAADFYRNCHRALGEQGILTVQSESPLANRDLIREVGGRLAGIFPSSGVYLGPVPTYPTGLWSYSYGSKGADISRFDPERADRLSTRYYNAAVHTGACRLPPFLLENG